MGGPEAAKAPAPTSDIVVSRGITENVGVARPGDEIFATVAEEYEGSLGGTVRLGAPTPDKAPSTPKSTTPSAELSPLQQLINETKNLATLNANSTAFTSATTSTDPKQIEDANTQVADQTVKDLDDIFYSAKEKGIILTADQKTEIALAYQKVLEEHGASSDLDEKEDQRKADEVKAKEAAAKQAEEDRKAQIKQEETQLREEIREIIIRGSDSDDFELLETSYTGRKGTDEEAMLQKFNRIKSEELKNYDNLLAEVEQMAKHNRTFEPNQVEKDLLALEKKYPEYMADKAQRAKLGDMYVDKGEDAQEWIAEAAPFWGVAGDRDDNAIKAFSMTADERARDREATARQEQMEKLSALVEQLAEDNGMLDEGKMKFHVREINRQFRELMADPAVREEMGAKYIDIAEDEQDFIVGKEGWFNYWKVNHGADTTAEKTFESTTPDDVVAAGQREGTENAAVTDVKSEIVRQLAPEEASGVKPTTKPDATPTAVQPPPQPPQTPFQKMYTAFVAFISALGEMFSSGGGFWGGGDQTPTNLVSNPGEAPQPVSSRIDSNRGVNLALKKHMGTDPTVQK